MCKFGARNHWMHAAPRWPSRVTPRSKILLSKLCARYNLMPPIFFNRNEVFYFLTLLWQNRRGAFCTTGPRMALYHMRGLFGGDILRAQYPNYLWKISKTAIKSVIILKPKNLWLLASALPIPFSLASARTALDCSRRHWSMYFAEFQAAHLMVSYLPLQP